MIFQGLDRNVEILPKLETLELEGLPMLRYIICNEDKHDSMRCLLSSSKSMNFHNLKYLSITYCGKEDQEEGHVNIIIEDEVLFGEKVHFLQYVFTFSSTVLGNIDKDIP